MADLFPVTIADAIAELRREMGMRKSVYPRLVEQGRLKPEEAARRDARLKKAIEILEAASK